MFFGKNIKFLRKKLALTQDQMLASIGVPRATWSNYELDQTQPDFEVLIKISDFFGVAIDDLLKVDVEISRAKGNLLEKKQDSEKGQKGKLMSNPSSNLNADLSPKPSDLKVITLAEDKADKGEKSTVIPITDISVAAGGGVYNTEYIEKVDSLRLPARLIKKGHTYYCVKIKGPSMSPTLQDGGYVIIRLLERHEWAKMPDERLYVVTDMDGKAYLKRVKNRFKQDLIILCSDNPDQASYPNFNLSSEEINTIWYVEWYLSAKMPNIHDQFYSRLKKLEDRVEQMVVKSK